MIPTCSLGFEIPNINNLLDNPEALKKIEARGKDFKEKLDRGELSLNSPSKRSSRNSRERDRRSSKSSHGESSRSVSHGESTKSGESRSTSRVEPSNKDKSRDTSSSKKGKEEEKKKKKEDKESNETSKHSEHKSSKSKIKELPKSWKDMKNLNLKIGDLPRDSRHKSRSRSRSVSPTRSRRSGKRTSRSRSRERKEGKSDKKIFPDMPKYFQTFKANRALSYGTKEYRGSLVQFTQSKPTITYCIDSNKYEGHYWSRSELKLKNRNRPEVMEIINSFLKSKKSVTNMPCDKGRLHSRQFSGIDDWLSERLTMEEQSISKTKKETALDYLTSSYKTDASQFFEKYDKSEITPNVCSVSSPFNDDSSSDNKSISLEDVSSPENKDSLDNVSSPENKLCIADAGNIESPVRKQSPMDIAELPEPKKEANEFAIPESKAIPSKNNSSSDNKLSTEELNEEYEAFINTLEFKPEEETYSLSEDTFDFNSSNLSFEEPCMAIKGENKELELAILPKSKKEVKKLLLDTKLSKKQRKTLKRLKKKLKKEKKERKKARKELKRKRKADKKMKKKQEKLMRKEEFKESSATSFEEVFNPDPLESLSDNSPESLKEANESAEEYQVLEWEEYHDDSPSEEPESSGIGKEYESPSSLLHTNDLTTGDQGSPENSNLTYTSNENSSNHSYTDTSGFYESSYSPQSGSPQSKTELSYSPQSKTQSSYSPQSKIESSTALSISSTKVSEEDPSNSESLLEEEEMFDTYSPSNMSVCSIESSPNKISSPYSPPSPEHYSHETGGDQRYTFAPSPYSPSSPQSSNSDATEQEKKQFLPSLDAIPMPPSGPTLADQSIPTIMNISNSTLESKSSVKENDLPSSPSLVSLAITSTPSTEVSSKSELKEVSPEETSPFKKMSQPVTFRLSLTKQSAGLKRLQKTPLPGFIQNEEEEDRRSPLFDLDETHRSRLTPLSPLRRKAVIKEVQKEEETKPLLSKDDSKEGLEKQKVSRSPSPKRSSKERERSHRRSHSSISKEHEEDKRPSSRVTKDSERTSEKSSSKSSSGDRKDSFSSSGDRKDSFSSSGDRKDSFSPTRRRERRKESSSDSKRRKRSRSPPQNSRQSLSKGGDSSSASDRCRSRSPAGRVDRSRSPSGHMDRSRSPSGHMDRSRSPSSHMDRTRSPSGRMDWSRSPSPSDKARGRCSRRDSRSQSPASKWKRIKSPPPRRYRENSPSWSLSQDDRSRYPINRDEERSRVCYSPRSNRTKGHSRHSMSPEKTKEKSPLGDPRNKEERKSGTRLSPKQSQGGQEYPDFSARPIDSISNLFPTNRNEGSWDWAEMGTSKDFYSAEEVGSSSRSPLQRERKKRSLTPDLSPKRLSLDERLKQEHGVDIEDEPLPPQGDYQRQGYYWEFNPPPMQPPTKSASGTAQVIRVGNVLQVLPQDSSPEKPSLSGTPSSMASSSPQSSSVSSSNLSQKNASLLPVPPSNVPLPNVLPSNVPPPSRAPSSIESEVRYEERKMPVPQIVQTGNVIQVVPSDNFPSPVSSHKDASDSASSVPVSHLEESQSLHLLGATPIKSMLPEIAPVPPPSSTVTSNPLAFISSLLASSMSQPLTTTEVSSATHPVTTKEIVSPAESSPMGEHPPQSPVKQSSDHRPADQEGGQPPPETSLPILDSQQQQAIISAAVAAAASGVTASNLPIAHLISVLQQQSLLSQPAVQPTPVSQADSTGSTQQLAVAEPAAEVKPKIDLEAFKQQRRERKERKRKEREMRRKARREKALLKKLELEEQKAAEEVKEEEEARSNELYDEDDAVIKEAITEVPELGSPIPEYEIYNDDEFLDEDEDEEEKKPPFVPLPLPPEKGILIGPTSRILRNNRRKSVSFADGIMPGYGTSPSGGEEIHSPPPPNSQPEKKEKKKVRKKKKVKVRIIKQYVIGASRMDSPPPPPDVPPTSGVLKLYPGCTHYTCTAPSTFVIYTQQPLKPNGTELGIAAAGTVTIPPGMLIHSSALSKGFASENIPSSMGTTIPPSMPHSYPAYGFSPFYAEGQKGIDQGTPMLQSPLA